MIASEAPVREKQPRQKNFPIMTPAELRAIREELGLTQAQAAARFEISLRGFKQYELGERAIPGPVRLLAKFFLQEHRKIMQ